MYPNVSTALTLPKVLGGISKTLNIVNQAIPLYKELKPIIKNANSILGVLREMNKPESPTKKEENSLIIESNPKKEEVLLTTSPTFFQ